MSSCITDSYCVDMILVHSKINNEIIIMKQYILHFLCWVYGHVNVPRMAILRTNFHENVKFKWLSIPLHHVMPHHENPLNNKQTMRKNLCLNSFWIWLWSNKDYMKYEFSCFILDPGCPSSSHHSVVFINLFLIPCYFMEGTKIMLNSV